MNTFILTEGNKHIGFGHITRCLSLLSAFQRIDQPVKIIVNGDASILSLLESQPFNLVNWLDRKTSVSFIQADDLVIIDSYLATSEDYHFFQNITKQIVYIDDNARLVYPPGVITNGSIYANDIAYSNNGNQFLLGPKYMLLRSPFSDAPKKKYNESVEKILITFGGDDFRHLTRPILEMITKAFPNLAKTVFIGDAFDDKVTIEQAQDQKTRLIYSPTVNQIVEAMLNVDLCISAGGQTLNELACLGVPTIGVLVAENQKNNISGWEKAGFILNAGWWENRDLFQKIESGVSELFSQKERQRRGKIGKAQVHGSGSLHVVQELFKLYSWSI